MQSFIMIIFNRIKNQVNYAETNPNYYSLANTALNQKQFKLSYTVKDTRIEIEMNAFSQCISSNPNLMLLDQPFTYRNKGNVSNKLAQWETKYNRGMQQINNTMWNTVTTRIF